MANQNVFNVVLESGETAVIPALPAIIARDGVILYDSRTVSLASTEKRQAMYAAARSYNTER